MTRENQPRDSRPEPQSQREGLLRGLNPWRRPSRRIPRLIKARRISFEPLEDRRLLSLSQLDDWGADSGQAAGPALPPPADATPVMTDGLPEIYNLSELTLESDSALTFEIGGYAPGPGVPTENGFDQINISGAATIDGTLEVRLLGGFEPEVGDTFDFLTFDSLSGEFDEVTAPFGFGDEQVTFEIVEQADRLQLVVSEIPTGTDLHTTTAATTRMETALEELADRSDRLLSDLQATTPELAGETLPGTNVSLDSLFGISDYLNLGPTLDAYLAPMQVLGSDVDFEIDEFLNYIRSDWLDDLLGGEAHSASWTEREFSGTGDWVHGVTVEFDHAASYEERVPVGLSETTEGIDPAYAELAVPIDARFAFTLSLGWSDTEGATYEFNVETLEFDVDTGVMDVIVPLSIGDLAASAGHPEETAATFDLDLHVDLAYDDADERYEVTYDPVGDDVSHVSTTLPIYASLAGIDVNPGAQGSIGIAGDLFLTSEGGRGSTDVAVTPSNLEAFSPFSELTLEGLHGQLELLRDDFLDNLKSAESFDVDIPFIDASLGDVLDLGAAFDLAVLSKLDFDSMESLQDFVASVTASGLIPAGQAITYNTTTKELTVPLNFDLKLDDLSLRDLDELGRIDLELLEQEGLLQIGAYIDPDVLLDGGHATLADLVSAGILSGDSIANWDNIDTDALIESGVITTGALAAHDLVKSGDVVSLDALIDNGLVTFGELIEAELVTASSLVGNLGFIREAEALVSNLADYGFDLLDSAFHQASASLVSLDDFLTSGLASLEDLFADGVLGLGDISLDSLGISDLLGTSLASLENLVDQGLLTVSDFASSTAVDITDFLSAASLGLGDLLDEALIDATDFARTAMVDAAGFFTAGIASLLDVVEAELLEVADFADLALDKAALITAGLVNQFELDFNHIEETLGNVSLHDLVESGVLNLEELVEEGFVEFTDLVTTDLNLGELLDSGVAEISDLINGALVQATDLATDTLDLQRLLDSGLASLEDIVGDSLVGLSDLLTEEIDIPALIESALPINLSNLVNEGLLTQAHVAAEEFLSSQLATYGDISGLITSGAIIDLDDLLDNSPIKLEHLVYFGIIDHNDVRPLGDVALADLTESKVIDSSLVQHKELSEIVEAGYLTVGNLVTLELLARADLADLPPADLDAFGFSESVIEAIEGDIIEGVAVPVANLVSETDVTIADLLRFGLIDADDLNADLSNVLLANIFVQGTVGRSALLASDLLESALMGAYATQNSRGEYVIAPATIVAQSAWGGGDAQVATADLIEAGLLSELDFDLSTVTATENDLLAWGLVTPNELDNNNLVQDTNPDEVNVGDLVALGIVSLQALAQYMAPAAMQLTVTEISLNDLYASNLISKKYLAYAGLGTSGAVDIEGLLATGEVTEEDLIEAGLAYEGDFWDDSAVSLSQLIGAGLVDAGDLQSDILLPLEDVLDSNAVGKQYIADADPAWVVDSNDDGRDDDGVVPIIGFLADANVTFEDAVTSGLLRGTRFVNKVFQLDTLEALEYEVPLGEPPVPTTVPRFEDGELDRLVHVGTVGLDTLLSSILYDVTLSEYIEEGFVDIHDFDDATELDVAAVEAEFGVDVDDSYVTTVPLDTLIALDYTGVTLLTLIAEGFVDETDLAAPVVELDIRDLEASDLFEDGDLNNYITRHDVYLYDLLGEIYIGDLVGYGLLDANDLIVNNGASLASMTDDGTLIRGDFDDVTLSATALIAEGLVTAVDLNTLNLVDGDDVSLYDLVNSELVALSELVDVADEGWGITVDDLSDDVAALKITNIHNSDILDRAILEANSLITGAESDQVFLNHAGTSLLADDVASLERLVSGGAVDPSHLDPAASIDKDDLVDAELATLDELIDAGLIAESDLAISSFDIEVLDRVGVLDMDELTDLDQIIALGLLSATEVDGLATLSGDDLVASGLVTESQLVSEGLFGTHVDLQTLLASELVTIDQLKTAGLDDRSGRVNLEDLLDAPSLSVTLSDLQTEGVVSADVEIDALLDSELVSLLDLVQTDIDKTALLAASFPDPPGPDRTITEADLVSHGLFNPNVDVADLVASELASAQNLIDAGLLSANIDSGELVDLNLVTGQQLVDTSLITQTQHDNQTYPSISVVSLLDALLDGGDAGSHLVTLDDLVYHDLLSTGTVDKNDLIAAAFTTATGVTITESDLVDEGLLIDTIDVDGLIAEGLATQSELETAGLIPTPLISRSDLDALGSVDYDTFNPVWIDIDLLQTSGLIGETDDRVSLDELLDTPIPALGGDALVEVSDLVRMGLIGETDLDGHNTNLFNLQGHAVSLAGDYGTTLTGMTTDAFAALSAEISGRFDLLIDLDGETGTPTEDELTYSLEDVVFNNSVGYDVIDFDVDARLGFIGTTLANVVGVENRVHVDISAAIVLDGDENIATSSDRTFLLSELADGTVVIDDNLISIVGGDATASVRGITVDTGLIGIPVGKGAEISLEVEDLTRDKTDSDYITLELRNLPGIFTIAEFFRADDLMGALLRARDYVMEAIDQLPFFVTDPNNPLYELLPDTTIPVINKTPRELLGVIDWLDDAVDTVQRTLLDPDNDVQALIGYIMDVLGLDPELDSDIFNVSVDGSAIKLSMNLEESFDENFPFDFDLAGYLGLSTGGVAGWDGIDDLIDIDASGNVNIKGFAEASVAFGIDLAPRQEGQTVDKFLYDWDAGSETGTRVAAGFKLLARDVSLGFEVFDSIGLETNDDGLDWDRDGVGGLDGELYTTDATIDADGDATTNIELTPGHEDDRSDFVTVEFLLDQVDESEVPDDGKYRFDETFFGQNVQFTGVDGGFELFMPLTVNIFADEAFGTEVDLSTPLHIRTNPAYDNGHNEGLEQIFKHLFAPSEAGPYDPVLITAPNIEDVVGDLADSIIRSLLEQIAEVISDLKQDLLGTDFLEYEIPGTGRTIESFFEDDTPTDNGLTGVPSATGLEAFLDIDTYITEYLKTVVWTHPTNPSVANGGISASDIWNGLVTFLNDHWVITLPGVGGTSGFITSQIDGDVLSISIDPSYTINRTFPVDLGTDLGDSGLEFVGDMDLNMALDAGIGFDFSVDLSGEGSTSFDFDEFYFDTALSASGINVGLTYHDVGITTNNSATAALNLGGSMYLEDGEFTFNHEQNKAGSETYQNSVDLYLPFYVGGLELGSLSFGDADFYDGELSPGFEVDLQNIGGILETGAYLVIDWLGEEIEDAKADLLPVYDSEDGSLISAGNEYLTKTIPGTDISLDRVLGLDSLLNLGTYARHYLRPELPLTGSGFTRDPSIPLGNPAAAGESGDSYYDQSGDPTLGGFFQYLEAFWIPTLGGQAGSLTWEPIMDGGDIVGIDVTFAQDFTFERQAGLDFGEQVESIGLTIDGDVNLDLDVDIELAMGLSFFWGEAGEGDDSVDFDIDNLTFQAHAAAEDIVVGAGIGPLRVSLGSEECEKALIAIDLGAEASYVDGVFDFSPTLNTATEHNNYVEIQAPIYASLGDVTFGECANPPATDPRRHDLRVGRRPGTGLLAPELGATARLQRFQSGIAHGRDSEHARLAQRADRFRLHGV